MARAKGGIIDFATYFDNLLTHQTTVDGSYIKNSDIAIALGYDNYNIISLWRKGRSPIPIEKLSSVAKILGVDRVAFVRRALKSYYPELYSLIEDCFGNGLVSDNEMKIVLKVREFTDDRDIRIATAKQTGLLRDFCNSLVENQDAIDKEGF
jgi:hypothetical protein